MTWKVEDDAAWIAEPKGNFRHYTGAHLRRSGSSWHATDKDGTVYPSRRSSGAALALLVGLWPMGLTGQTFGTVEHPTTPIDDDGIRFGFMSPDGSPFTPLVVSSLKRRFFGHARCAKCKEPMSEFRTAQIGLMDGVTSKTHTYLVCSCGYPAWHMEADAYYGASHSMYHAAKKWERDRNLKAAGGKHSKAEIEAILALQEGRCIYCHKRFTDKLRATRDHLVPVSYGGTSWALNIVLACHSCNSRRGEVPFRTFCRLLSPRQNERIFNHLMRRIRAIDFQNVSGGYEDLEIALRLHVPNDFRYKMILSMKAAYRENARRNKLLPRGVSGFQMEMLRRLRAKIRLLKQREQ